MESTTHVFPLRIVFFYLVTTGWIFDMSLCENSINQCGCQKFSRWDHKVKKTPFGRKTYNVLSIQERETATNGTEYSGKAASPKNQKRTKTKLCITVVMLGYDWWLCMMINISIHHHSGRVIPDNYC